MFGKKVNSVGGSVLPCVIAPLIMFLDLSFSQWRLFMVIVLLTTVAMLYHKRLRHYLLLPSSLVLAGCMAAILLDFSEL